MGEAQPKKLEKNQILKVEDASITDERIPRNLILMYGDTPYIMKAGLEWKANQLFGAAGYRLELDPIEMNYKESIFVFKATLTVLKNQTVFTNYGEATVKNVNSRMHGQLLHLAATRAECRVLRMATATGYASYDEVMTMNEPEKTPQPTDPEKEIKPATSAQIETIKTLLTDPEKIAELESAELTFEQAAKKISELAEATQKTK